ncbi:MAG TPA: nitroreductase/quinone reductase family protein, partial [Anaerolineales bacterium]|nr:nitroreductase/quinone reductase family protein [Anaerolineales bacterium]
MIDEPRTGWLYAALRKITASRVGIWLFSPTLHLLDRATLALSMGNATLSGFLGGVSVVTVTPSAGRTGKARSVPLFGIPAGEAIIVIASNWGRPHNPSWYRRLKADPRVAVTYRNRTA